LKSILIRYAANSARFMVAGQGEAARRTFSQPPKPRFIQVAYDSEPSRRTYELRNGSTESGFAAWPLAKASNLVVWLRDSVADRLRGALPDRSADIERAMIGRKADGRDDGPSSARVRIVPLPSIGHQHADHAIRRVLVEVPAGCLLRQDDVHWAFSGQEWVDPKTGAIEAILTPSSDAGMLRHFGVAEGAGARVWRTLTPAALPESAKRRRIDPARTNAEAKGGAERADEEARAAAAVVQALRHADVQALPERIHLQREPFEAKGQRAEAFAPQTRFAKERLWHVEITFREPIPGPLVVGDGRFLGLGVMAPVQASQGVHAFMVESGLAVTAEPTEVARAVRRAVMARVQQVVGRRERLPTFFSGHERDGSAARTGHQHLTFLFDPVTPRILVVAPHVLERRPPTGEEAGYLRDLDAALIDFRDLRAGSAGRLTLGASTVDPDVDPLFAPSQTWETLTPYNVTRHARHADAAAALSADLCAECRRCGLPQARVTPNELRGVPGMGLTGGARLTFGVAVTGPIVLGRSRHFGGGLFAGRP
jgi:CRISPR-associated protein Csb2